LRQLFSPGTTGVEVLAMTALRPTLAREPAKGNWAPSSGSLVSVRARGLQLAAEDLEAAHDLPTPDQSRLTFPSFAAICRSSTVGKGVRHSPSYRSVPPSKQP